MSDKQFHIINHYDVPKQIYDEKKDTVFGIEKASYLLNCFAEENNRLKKENERLKTKGLQILDFYESQILDAYGTENYQTVLDEWSLIKFVLCEMGLINNE